MYKNGFGIKYQIQPNPSKGQIDLLEDYLYSIELCAK